MSDRGTCAVFARRVLWALWLVVVLVTMPQSSRAQSGTSTVQGTLFSDANKDGIRNAGESVIPSRSVIMSGSGGIYVAVSGTDGKYIITGVQHGEYQIEGVVASGLFPTAPSSNLRNVSIAAPGTYPGQDFGYFENCARITVKKILWKVDGSGCFTMTFSLTNLAPYPVGHIFSLNNAPVIVTSPLTSSQNYIPVTPPMAPGETRDFTVTICGVPPGSNFLWELNLHDPELLKCCAASVQIPIPDCKCFQILEESTVCNPDGSVTWCATFQNLEQAIFYWMFLVPPAGVTINPTVVSLPGVPFGGTWSVCVTITGAIPGSTLTLPIVIRDKARECCRLDVKIPIPICFCTDKGDCWDRAPVYQDRVDGLPYGTQFPGTVAVITCWGSTQVNDYASQPVVAVQNLDQYQTTAVPLGVDWVPSGKPRGYHGVVSATDPMGSWNIRNLGSVFGVTLDKYGNIFVTHTSCFGNDYLPQSNGQSGMVYMIRNGDGAIFSYCKLPNLNSANSSNNWLPSESWPGLGNITYDGDHDQLFVTNHEDGKIYRIAGTGGVSTSQGSWIDTYDPADATYGWTADSGSPGMVNLGDRLWGVQYHGGRVFFARWRVDRGNPDPTKFNEIWSIGVQPAGGAFATSLQKELDVPHFANFDWSMPVSDISFSPDGKMMLAERGLGTLSYPSTYGQPNANVPEWSYPWTAHAARGIEYRCEGPKWTPTNLKLDLGYIGPQPGFNQSSSESCSGGTDYDYSPATIANSPTAGRRIWFTINGYSTGAYGTPPYMYGIQGVHPTAGGAMAQSILNDADGNTNTTAKTALGDVEIPCPHQGIAGRVQLIGYLGAIGGRSATVRLMKNGAIAHESSVVLDDQGRFYLPLSVPDGLYSVGVKAQGYLRRAVLNVDPSANNGEQNFTLIPGDIDGDNLVTIFDYIALSDAFDKSASDPDWSTPNASGRAPRDSDLDGDGVVSIFDYILLSDHFDSVGDLGF